MSGSVDSKWYEQANNSSTYVDENLIAKLNRSTNVGKGANLDKDAFLKLLVAQMRYQDPLEPMDNSESIAQMATFTTLEQLIAMNTTMSNYFNYQIANSLIQYSHLIGQEVAYELPVVAEDGTITDKVEKGSSVVTGMEFKNSTVVLTLENGKNVEVGYVASIGKVSESKKEESDKKDDSAQAPTDKTDKTEGTIAGDAAKKPKTAAS